MDLTKNEIASHFDITIPAHLLIGSSTTLVEKSITLLQQFLCPTHGCHTCTSCRMIQEQQHHAIMWIHPEKNYTREQFEPLFAQLAFERSADEPFFFIIEKADFLPPACANSLLKSVEEPPQGYHFLFLAERLNLVTPTIRSRCAIHTFSRHDTSYQQHPLFDFFTSTHFHDPGVFAKAIDQSGITERESVELLDALLSYWISENRSALLENDAHKSAQSQHMIHTISQAHKKQPMPGSSKLFWRNLFLSAKGVNLQER